MVDMNLYKKEDGHIDSEEYRKAEIVAGERCADSKGEITNESLGEILEENKYPLYACFGQYGSYYLGDFKYGFFMKLDFI